MIKDVDIWRAADVLLKQYGDEAVVIAAQRADALLDKGDVDGQRAFKRVIEAINELQRGHVLPPEQTH
jgi:DNA-directed RNA polymerase subunit K/omega